jgi:CheY-like chemotaxis protein
MIAETTPPGNATIIVIDDNQEVLKANQLLFEVEGYSVLAAANGAGAVSLLENCDDLPKVIVSDFHLANNEKGTDVIRSIRRKLQSEIPAILMTGDTTSIMRNVKDIVGNCHVVSKPADIPTLVALLSNATKSGKV